MNSLKSFSPCHWALRTAAKVIRCARGQGGDANGTGLPFYFTSVEVSRAKS